MKKGIIIILVCALSVLLTGCGNSNTTSTNVSSGTANNEGGNNSVVETGDLAKNIESSGAVTDLGKMVVFVKNKNVVPVDMEIEVEFYDENNEIVGSAKDDLNAVGKNSEIAIDLWSTPDKFDNYKIYVDVKQSTDTCYFDKVGITHKDTKEHVAVQVKNNSEDEVEYIKVGVVFYKDGKVVGYDDGIQSDIKSGRSGNFNIDHPYNKKYNNVKYDEYKVFLNGAYSYNW